MRWVAVGTVMLLAGLPTLWAGDEEKDKAKEPEKSKVAQEVDALIAAYQESLNDYNQTIQEKLKDAKTDEEKAKIYQSRSRLYPKPDETMDKLWPLIEMNPDDKEASLAALQWLLRHYAYDEKGQQGRARALDVLTKRHADDPNIGSVLSTLHNMYSDQSEELFRDVMAKNPSKEARGVACLSLGMQFMSIVEGIQYLKMNPVEVKRFESLLGKETAKKLEEGDSAKFTKEAEAAFAEAADKYGDVVLFTNPTTKKKFTVGDKAAAELFEIRNLAIGRSAPDIVGDDLDGKPLKLSDFRGKVVVLDFWGNW